MPINASKSACYSRQYDLENCPYRYDAGIPIGTTTAPDGTVSKGIMVGGAPVGDNEYLLTALRSAAPRALRS